MKQEVKRLRRWSVLARSVWSIRNNQVIDLFWGYFLFLRTIDDNGLFCFDDETLCWTYVDQKKKPWWLNLSRLIYYTYLILPIRSTTHLRFRSDRILKMLPSQQPLTYSNYFITITQPVQSLDSRRATFSQLRHILFLLPFFNLSLILPLPYPNLPQYPVLKPSKLSSLEQGDSKSTSRYHPWSSRVMTSPPPSNLSTRYISLSLSSDHNPFVLALQVLIIT